MRPPRPAPFDQTAGQEPPQMLVRRDHEDSYTQKKEMAGVGHDPRLDGETILDLIAQRIGLVRIGVDRLVEPSIGPPQ